MPRILKTRRPLANKTVRFGQAVGISKNVLKPPATRVTSKAGVVRKMFTGRRNPLDLTGTSENVNTRAVVDQFTNNPNPAYDPSKGPKSVGIAHSRVKPPQSGGHGKDVKAPRILKGGARIKKR